MFAVAFAACPNRGLIVLTVMDAACLAGVVGALDLAPSIGTT